MSRALEDIRVIDLSHVLAAPTATMFLADLGAEVIQVLPCDAQFQLEINTTIWPGTRTYEEGAPISCGRFFLTDYSFFCKFSPS